MSTRIKKRKVAEEYPYTLRQRVAWTLSNLLILTGCYIMLYVGGVYSYVEYQRAAARGDSGLAAPQILVRAPSLPAVPAVVERHGVALAQHATMSGTVSHGALAAEQALTHVSRVERLILPSIAVDAKVIEVGWEVVEQDGQLASLWQVAEFAVGQHKGSANPGEGDNIVLAGHVGGYGQIFRDLFYVLPGDPVIVYSDGHMFHYTVSERLIVDEEGPHVTEAQRQANAQLIAPTDYEVLTMVTCWPATGPDRFMQRVIIRALPDQ
ncbi:MAG: sortase [Candidatus Viridilinea halotolerans]|uniref:Sortase n=1 Tax=Candidatus Viridilinea halotolerans TaxID=2491704 RepID=A0A426TRL7_9CHLR|nr:MAG: sortase [Candidatus Viridilinea halotolerans]